jgi:peptidoglycan-associated lipoprotein
MPEPPEAPEPSIKPARTITDAVRIVNSQLEDAYFSYDRFDLDGAAQAALHRDFELLLSILADFPAVKFVVEGHCDERGSAEYNLALGDRRASSAVALLVQLGLPKTAATIVSYGKESPQCFDHAEACYRLNRRAHVMVRQ